MGVWTVLTAVAVSLSLVASSQPCPTWFTAEAGECKCGARIYNLLECSESYKEIRIMASHCLTYSNSMEYFGACPYNTRSTHLSLDTVPSNVTMLNEVMCGPLNRTGMLCTECQPGLGPAVFSYHRECKECMKWPYGWIVYSVRQIVPLTLFCVAVIIFQIDLTNPTLNGFVIAAQLISSVLSNNPFIIDVIGESYSLTKFVVDFYGIFTLDFFVYLLPSFCIKEDMSMRVIVLLDYFTALYPILFTIIVYQCITLHDKGCWIVVICWKPFHKCLARFRRRWNPKGSIINSFSTFLLLFYCKISSASVYFIQPAKVWDKFGNWTYRMYFDTNFDLHKSLIYVLYFAIVTTIFALTVLLPAVFILFYQNKFFQRCLFFCRFKFKLIHEVISILQGSFKNGTSPGTRDYRWFAGLYLLLRSLLVVLMMNRCFQITSIAMFSVMAVMVAGLQPYKNNRHNITDTLLWLLASIGMSCLNYEKEFDIRQSETITMYIIGALPFVYISCCTSWRVITYITKPLRARLVKMRRPQVEVSIDIEEALPHRLLNPNEYTPLLESRPLYVTSW